MGAALGRAVAALVLRDRQECPVVATQEEAPHDGAHLAPHVHARGTVHEVERGLVPAGEERAAQLSGQILELGSGVLASGRRHVDDAGNGVGGPVEGRGGDTAQVRRGRGRRGVAVVAGDGDQPCDLDCAGPGTSPRAPHGPRPTPEAPTPRAASCVKCARDGEAHSRWRGIDTRRTGSGTAPARRRERPDPLSGVGPSVDRGGVTRGPRASPPSCARASRWSPRTHGSSVRSRG